MDKAFTGDTVTQGNICETSLVIWSDLVKETQDTSMNEASEESLKAR